MAHAAHLLGLPLTEEAAAGAPGERRPARGEHKRVDNRRMRAELLPRGLAYPSYREGLQAVIDATT